MVEKLGFRPGETVFVEDTPDWYSAFAEENGFELEPGLPATHAHLFLNSKKELAKFLKDNDLEEIEKSLWVSWPKKSSGVKTDLTEQDFRNLILPTGWVDVKVVAIDDTWTGFKFLRRKR
ncbi:MAG TPA: DUF3052 domain-containing protein [Candidatus Saccharimonadia bacterium]|nr:DUF3052 domain-containing protein [Candidatus Saccharimonadia bacterium]